MSSYKAKNEVFQIESNVYLNQVLTPNPRDMSVPYHGERKLSQECNSSSLRETSKTSANFQQIACNLLKTQHLRGRPSNLFADVENVYAICTEKGIKKGS